MSSEGPDITTLGFVTDTHLVLVGQCHIIYTLVSGGEVLSIGSVSTIVDTKPLAMNEPAGLVSRLNLKLVLLWTSSREDMMCSTVVVPLLTNDVESDSDLRLREVGDCSKSWLALFVSAYI